VNNVLTLDQLFHRRLFRVPDYQRGYAWESQQIEELLEDLEILAQGRYHYTGTVVLHDTGNQVPRMDSDGNTYDGVDIVDGQQRIATIVLLLDAIRRVLAELGPTAKALANGIGKNYIATTEINGQSLHKLSLNTDCDHFFKNSVLKDRPGIEGPQITSERRLAAAKEQIAKYVGSNAGEDEDSQEHWLRELYEKVVTQLRLSLYEVDSEADAGVIFEVMNNRGKQLSELEKVKNFLLYAGASLHVNNDLAAAVNSAWAEILRQLMAADLVSSPDENRLLRAHWLTQYDPQPRKWDGSKSVKERFDLRKFRDDRPALLEQLHRYTEGLRSTCISFCDAYNPERPDAFRSYSKTPHLRSQVIAWSAKLTRIGVVATFLPLLMAIRHRWPDSPDRYLEMLRLCEAYAFRVYRLQGARADAGQSSLFFAGHSLFHGTASFEEVCRRVKGELLRRCNDAVFASHWVEGPDEWYGWTGLKYFLYEYETHLASTKGASPNVGWREIRNQDLKDTIEHILPQTIDNVRYWRERFRRRPHREYVHDLGNLSLTKHNSHYSNKPFPDKKGSLTSNSPCYATSPFYMERELAAWEEWDATVIEERKERLANWAMERWAVDLSDVEAAEEPVGSVDDDEQAEVDDLMIEQDE
jgi:hypothetical protein